MFLVFPSLQHLAAFTSAILGPRPHQSARIEWPWGEAPASAVPGWVLPHNSWDDIMISSWYHHDIIMISSWYHEPRKGSIKIHLNCCCQILWAHFLNRISVHLNMTPGDKLDKCWDSSKARENHVASLICPELLNQQIWTSFAEEKASSHMLNDKLAQKKTHANAVLRPEQQRRGFQDRHRTMAACLLDLHSSPWKVSTSSCLRTAR